MRSCHNIIIRADLRFLRDKNCIIFYILMCFCATGFAQSPPVVTITVNKSTNNLELRNGLLGIVVPGDSKQKLTTIYPAPIQSFIFTDGTYSDNSPNYLRSQLPPVSMSTKIASNTPKQASVIIEYKFQKPVFGYGDNKYPGDVAGMGFYRCTIMLRRGEKNIVIEEESDYDIQYHVKISLGLSPDKARYRGWSSGSVQNGYEPSGIQYRPENLRGYPLDATVKLNYARTFSFPRLVLWEPAGGEVNSGRYWQCFNDKASSSANLLGFFQGKPSRLLGAKDVGPYLEANPSDTVSGEKDDAEIGMYLFRRGPDNSWYPRKRFQWAVFISTKNDLLAPEKQQPIGDELNKVAGLANVIQQYWDKPVTLVPSFYEGAIYMPADQIATICKATKTDKKYYDQLCRNDISNKSIWDAWRFPDSAQSLLKAALMAAANYKNAYIHGSGTYLASARYWGGVLNFKFWAMSISCLFADKSLRIEAAEKKQLEQFVAMMARIVWDDNNVPLFDSAGINLGPANMSFQYRNNGRIFFLFY